MTKGKIFDENFRTCRLLSDKYRAKVITITHLAISEGWKPKDNPKLIHLYVPAVSWPINGNITNTIINPYNA